MYTALHCPTLPQQCRVFGHFLEIYECLAYVVQIIYQGTGTLGVLWVGSRGPSQYFEGGKLKKKHLLEVKLDGSLWVFAPPYKGLTMAKNRV